MFMISQCGPDWVDIEPSSLPEGTETVLYWYESGSYEGSGTAYARTAGGRFYTLYLGHCSCYGPGEAAQWEDLTLSIETNMAGEPEELRDAAREAGWIA